MNFMNYRGLENKLLENFDENSESKICLPVPYRLTYDLFKQQ